MFALQKLMLTKERTTRTDDAIAIARAAYEAYGKKDRAALERLIAEDFHFTSPLDNRIDRATYFARCWPNSEWIERFDFVNLVRDGERVFVTYEGHGSKRNNFRNTEIVTLRGSQIVEIEVYFGWPIPHEAEAGGFLPGNDARLKEAPMAKTGMLIRKPVGEVFAAFIDPEVTTKFWFTKSSGRLEAGKPVTWEWEMYGASTRVIAKAIEPNRRIVIEWDGYSGRTQVEWKFAPQNDGTTFVSIAESGWSGSGDELVKYAANSTQGFTWTLAGLKALLEHNLRLNLVADRFPRGPQQPYPDQ
jgi:uncharacterized protein YndB with AHSA1/START domain/ketosteroid isomerase-like protein